MIHILNRVKELIKQLDNEKFNGIWVECVLEGSDEPEPGEQTIEQKVEWDKNYAIFTVHPDLPDPYMYQDITECKYMDIEVHEHLFWADFKKMLTDIFKDSGATIIIRHPCDEVEIYREQDE